MWRPEENSGVFSFQSMDSLSHLTGPRILIDLPLGCKNEVKQLMNGGRALSGDLVPGRD